MRPRIHGLTNAVDEFLRMAYPQSVWWKDVCDGIVSNSLVAIEPAQEEITWNQPNYQHSVRRILSELVKNQQAVHVKRGYYKYRSPIGDQ